MQLCGVGLQIEGDTAGMSEERENKLFPDKEQEDQRITCHDVTNDFLIYATDVSVNLLHVYLLYSCRSKFCEIMRMR